MMFMMILSASIGIIWSMPTLLLNLLGITLHKLTGAKMTSFLSKHVSYASIMTSDDPAGWICGKYYIGYIHETEGQQGARNKDLYLLTTDKYFKVLTLGPKNDDIEKKQITFLEREGMFWNLSYPSRLINPPTDAPWNNQKQIVDEIIENFSKAEYSTVLLVGQPGAGKSMIPLQLCGKLLETCEKVTFVDTWNPTDPGDSFAAIYNKVNPTIKKPLVVVLEEIDGIILSIHKNEIKYNQNIPMPIQIKSKTDWNQFLDRFDRKMDLGVILCLTSNKSLSWFDELDPSYTRAGRINLRIEVLKI